MQNKPALDLFLDLDESLVRNDLETSELVFNGASKLDDLGPWQTLLEFPEMYSDYVDLRIRVLTARIKIDNSSFKIAKKLNLKPRLKSSGMELESKTKEIHFAMYYPIPPRVYFFSDDLKKHMVTPCLVWQKTQDSAQLYYHFDQQGNYDTFPLSKEEINKVHSLIDDGLNGLLNESKHAAITQTIREVGSASRLIIFSAAGKQISNTRLENSNIEPAYCFACYVPKATVMQRMREQAVGNVIASILIDDRASHQSYFGEKDIWIDCSIFQSLAFKNLELRKEVNELIEYTESEISNIISLYAQYKENMIILSDKLNKGIHLETKLNSFAVNKRNELDTDYQSIILRHENLKDDKESASGFVKIMSLCDDFEILAKERVNSVLSEQKLENPLDSLLRLANLNSWKLETRYGGSRIFNSAFPKGILQIRTLLQDEDREQNDYADLLEILTTELEEPIISYCHPKIVVFYHLILKLHELQAVELPDFNHAANIIILKFKEEFEFFKSGKHADKQASRFAFT